MKNYTADKVRNVVLLGHSGSGKTTYAEAALFFSGATKRFGKVDEGNTVSDYEAEEIRRKVSINTSVLPIEWQDTKINFLDTPGYFDFVAEAKLAMSVADTALIMVSAKSGVEVGTEKAWEYAEEMHLPRFIFVNQMDDENADFEKTLADLRTNFGKAVAPLQIPFNDENGNFIGFINLIKKDARKKINGKLQPCQVPADKVDQVEVLRSMLVEVAAESSEELMEKFFNDIELTEEEIYDGLLEGIKNHSICPVMCGSATLGYGVKLLMNTLVRFTSPAFEARKNFHAFIDGTDTVLCSTEDKTFSAFVFKTISDPYIGRLNLFRVMTGKLDNSMNIYNVEKDTFEKVGHLYIVRGKEQIEVNELHTGDIGALAKLTNTSTQDTLATKENPIVIPKLPLPSSVLSMAIQPKGKGDEDKLSAALSKIREEDPTIKMEVNKETKQTLISGIGEQQMDVMVNKLKTKYKIEVDMIDPIIPFRETVKGKSSVRGRYKKQSGGHGQFGDIVMEFEPSGDMTLPYVFEEKIFGGSVPKQYFPAVEKGLQECVLSGVLAGYPVVGLKATLTDGSYHPVDSSEMAFKMATSVAFKEGVPQAKPILLEPIEHVEVLVPERYMGDIMGDINKRRGRILSMDAAGNKKCIIAEVPTSEMHKYATDLRSMTQSRGEYKHYFVRYEEAPMEIQKKIIERRAAEKEK
ncbi:elongation factor G [Anaerotignum neopropionicum]|uniref:Elongation factor G n=1 Tax=Anaerotignum neopropionicum TaxID=36847 RepID=A0A136WF04_9FIRM|nr:elongation factor G [Anaerotignum neopropionicum]KXL53064.1 elongation factor G [Anaerotignum neopropionicum]